MATNKKVNDGVAKATPSFPSGKYKCPKCSNKIEVFVNMTMPPACTKHSGGLVAMETTT